MGLGNPMHPRTTSHLSFLSMSFEYLVCPFATNHVGIETAFHEEKFASTPSVMTTSNFHQLKEGQAQQDLRVLPRLRPQHQPKGMFSPLM